MQRIISTAIAALLLVSANAQSGSGSMPATTSATAYQFVWSYDVPLIYETTYYSGIGPYRSTNIFKNIDSSMHYEEYGFDFNFYATATMGIHLGDVKTATDYYYLAVSTEADILKITPYKQVTWF